MRYFILDVFTEERFKGNPLAVVLDADDLSTEAMQAMAREFNLSETTFVMRPTSPRAAVRVRIFTPALELPLAGHPVIGTWYLLASEKRIAVSDGWNIFRQEVLAGIFPVEIRVAEERVSEVWMTQGAPQYFENPPVEHVMDAFHLKREDLSSVLPVQFVSTTGVKQLIVPLTRREVLSRLRPSFDQFSALLGQDSHLAYAFVDEDNQVRARAFFYARNLVFEDPATGSAAGALTAHLWKYRGQSSLAVYQGEEMGRGAVIRTRISDDGLTVKVGGTAVIVATGTIL